MYRSLLVMWPLQQLLSDKRQNSHSFCFVRQNRQYQLYWLMRNWLSGFGFGLVIGVYNFILSDMDWIRSRWKSFGLDQDCKIYISVHHWSAMRPTQLPIRPLRGVTLKINVSIAWKINKVYLSCFAVIKSSKFAVSLRRISLMGLLSKSISHNTTHRPAICRQCLRMKLTG